MATVIDALLVTLGLDSKEFRKGSEDSQNDLEKLRKKAEDVAQEVKGRGAQVGEFFTKFAAGAAALLGVGLTLQGVRQAIEETAASYYDLAKLAEQFGTTADAIDGFVDAGELLGVSDEATMGSLKALDRAVQDTAMGIGRAKVVFEDLGIEVKDSEGKVKSVTDVMGELSAKFEGMERGKQVRVMERLGLNPELLKMFSSDMAEIGASMADLQRRTDAIDSGTGFSFAKAIENSKQFTKTMKGLQLEINSVRMFFEKLFETAYIRVMPFLSEMMVSAKERVADFFDFLTEHKDVVVGVFIAIGAAVTYYLLPPLIGAARAAIATIAPFLGIAAAIAAVVAIFAVLYEDWAVWMDGGTSQLSAFWQFFADVWGKIGGTVTAVLGDVADVFKSTFAVLIDTVKFFAALFGGNADDIRRTWGNLCASIGNLWGDLWKLEGDVVDAAVAIIGATFAALWAGLKFGASEFSAWLNDRIGVIAAYFDEIAPNAMRVFRDIRDEVFAVFSIIGSLFRLVVALWTGDAAEVSAIFDDLTTHIRMFFTAAFDHVQAVAEAVFGAIVAVVQTAINIVVAIVTGFVPAVVGLFGKVAEGIKNIWSGLWSGLRSVASGVLDWLTGRLETVAMLFSKIGQAMGFIKGPQVVSPGQPSAAGSTQGSAQPVGNTTATPAPVAPFLRPSAVDSAAALDAARPAVAATAIPPSVANSAENKTTITKETHIGEIVIHTQAQDAQGIAQDIGGAVQSNSLADQADAGI